MMVGGFRLFDTHGVPLAVQIEVARARGCSVSVPDFYRDALRAGWRPERALATVEEPLVDTGAERSYIDKALTYLQRKDRR